MEEAKPKPKRTPKSTPSKPTPKAIIVMFKTSSQYVGSIEVDNMDQAKAVQGTLNDWFGSHTLTKFIYV